MGNPINVLMEGVSQTVSDFLSSQGIFDDSEGDDTVDDPGTIVVPPSDDPTDDPPSADDLMSSLLLFAANGAANSNGLQSPLNVYGRLVQPTDPTGPIIHPTSPTGDPVTPINPPSNPGKGSSPASVPSHQQNNEDSDFSTSRSNKKKKGLHYPHPLIGMIPMKKKSNP